MFQNQKWLTQWVSDKVTYWAVGWTAKNAIPNLNKSQQKKHEENVKK